MSDAIRDLYSRYRSELKPLITEYESENEKFVTSWLVLLSQMFDRVALYETDDDPKSKEENLKMANKHLETAIADACKSVYASGTGQWHQKPKII